MSDLVDTVLNLLWMIGLVIPVLFGAGIWLFYSMKKSQEEQDKRERDSDSQDT